MWEQPIPDTLRIRRLAEQLVSFETVDTAATPLPSGAAFRVSDKLRQPLCSITGTAGFSAMLSRALTLSKAEFPRFSAVSVNRRGVLEGFSDISPSLSPEEVARGEVILITHMVELLCALIGEALVLRLIQGTWPDATFLDQNSENEGTHE